jgi:hypothetical protein
VWFTLQGLLVQLTLVMSPLAPRALASAAGTALRSDSFSGRTGQGKESSERKNVRTQNSFDESALSAQRDYVCVRVCVCV